MGRRVGCSGGGAGPQKGLSMASERNTTPISHIQKQLTGRSIYTLDSTWARGSERRDRHAGIRPRACCCCDLCVGMGKWGR